MTTLLEPGSYSHGTLRDTDMCDMFATIGTITLCKWCESETEILNRHLADPQTSELHEYISESIHYLFDHVEEHHTPEGFYFGNIEGDGSDFGVWVIESDDTTNERRTS